MFRKMQNRFINWLNAAGKDGAIRMPDSSKKGGLYLRCSATERRLNLATKARSVAAASIVTNRVDSDFIEDLRHLSGRHGLFLTQPPSQNFNDGAHHNSGAKLGG